MVLDLVRMTANRPMCESCKILVMNAVEPASYKLGMWLAKTVAAAVTLKIADGK